MGGLTTWAQVMTDLSACLARITTANGYTITVAQVLRGIHQDADVKRRPALTFSTVGGDSADLTGGLAQRRLGVLVQGFADAKGGDFSAMHALAAAAQRALVSPTHNPTLHERVDLGRLTVYEGGLHDPVGLFDLLLTVEFDYDRTNP